MHLVASIDQNGTGSGTGSPARGYGTFVMDTTTVIFVSNLNAYDGPFNDLDVISTADPGDTVYVRTTVTDPFGADDITSVVLRIEDSLGGVIVNNVELDDTYIVDLPTDFISEQTAAGTDLVQSTVNYSLRPNIENLTLLGTANLQGIGNAENNILIGINSVVVHITFVHIIF